MSETVHYKGKLTPTGQTLKEFDSTADDILDHYYKAVEINGMVYTVEKTEVDQYDDIFKSSNNDDGTIDFEVKYYNGGCGFNEAIDMALDAGGEQNDWAK